MRNQGYTRINTEMTQDFSFLCCEKALFVFWFLFYWSWYCLSFFQFRILINLLGIVFKLSQQRNSWIQWDRLMGGSRRSNKPYFSHICYYCFFVSLSSLWFATDEDGCAVENFCNTLFKCVYNLHEEIFCLIVYY